MIFSNSPCNASVPLAATTLTRRGDVSPDMSLEEVSTEALMAEISRRLACQNKPEKRLILVGPPGCGKVRGRDR